MWSEEALFFKPRGLPPDSAFLSIFRADSVKGGLFKAEDGPAGAVDFRPIAVGHILQDRLDVLGRVKAGKIDEEAVGPPSGGRLFPSASAQGAGSIP